MVESREGKRVLVLIAPAQKRSTDGEERRLGKAHDLTASSHAFVKRRLDPLRGKEGCFLPSLFLGESEGRWFRVGTSNILMRFSICCGIFIKLTPVHLLLWTLSYKREEFYFYMI